MLVEAPVKRRKGSQHQKEEHFGLRPQEALRSGHLQGACRDAPGAAEESWLPNIPQTSNSINVYSQGNVPTINALRSIGSQKLPSLDANITVPSVQHGDSHACPSMAVPYDSSEWIPATLTAGPGLLHIPSLDPAGLLPDNAPCQSIPNIEDASADATCSTPWPADLSSEAFPDFQQSLNSPHTPSAAQHGAVQSAQTSSSLELLTNQAGYADQFTSPIQSSSASLELPSPAADGVASPVAERLSQLREINQLRGLTPRTAKHKALYHKNLQDLCPGQRWIELSPALAPSSINRSMATLEMWCEGRLAGGAGLTFAAAGPMFKLVLLADLAAVPMSAWQNFAGHLTAQVVNAQTFSRQRGDALEQCSAQICAAVTTAWFTVTALSPLHSEAVQAMEGAGFDTAGNFREDPPTTITYPTRTLLDMLELTEHQQSLAKVIWRDWHADLASVKEDRRRILSCLQASGAATFMQYGMRPDSYSETNTILQQAAALAENSALQQEITLQGQRRFMLEICSPESAARLWTAVWPHWPDKADLLRQPGYTDAPAKRMRHCHSWIDHGSTQQQSSGPWDWPFMDPMASQASVLSSDAFSEACGVGLENTLSGSLPAMTDLSSEAFCDPDTSSGKLPQTEPIEDTSNGSLGSAHHEVLASSLQDLSSSQAIHDDLHQRPLPSIFADVDLTSLRPHMPGQVRQHRDHAVDGQINAGQTASGQCMLRLSNACLSKQAWSTDLQRSLATHPAVGYSLDAKMYSSSANVSRLSSSTAQRMRRTNAERSHAWEEVRRHRHPSSPVPKLVGQQENQLLQLLHSLAQPAMDSAVAPVTHRLSCMRGINQLRGMTARTAKYKALYRSNLGELCPSQRWVQLCPWLAPPSISQSMATLAAWSEGRLPSSTGHTVAPLGRLFKPVPLAELAMVPLSAFENCVGHLVAQIVNAQIFSKTSGDAPAQRSAEIVGALTTQWFYVAALSLEHTDAVQAMEGNGFNQAGKQI
ncbi:hypothetical protein WJX74_005501 [Apatococcus lobatus]|uniref:Uncharacterized protein n=1 Tax=Apatococcus lobatus TaxID=904363 RepID=A0AAW1SBJ1_9CHLO